MTTNLQIYVSETCWGCQEARKIAAEMRVEFPGVHVELIVRELAKDWPDEVIATPAYRLNGKLVSLGNPARERLRNLLADGQDRPSAPGG